MVSNTSDISIDVIRNLFVDRYGLQGLDNFQTVLNAMFYNKSPQTVYVLAKIDDTAGNWKFSDGSTEKAFYVYGFSNSSQTFTLQRAVPTGDTTEDFNLIFEFYKDSGHTKKIDQITKPITAYIVDFRNNPQWIEEFTTFDDFQFS